MHVQPFDDGQLPTDNAAKIVGYALKAGCSLDVGRMEDTSPAHLRAEWFAWLGSMRVWSP